MNEGIPPTPPVREALDDVVGSTRTIVLKRLDLLQLEAEHLVDDAASRLSEASAAIVLATLALLVGTVGLVALGEPHLGLPAASFAVAVLYGLSAALFARSAKRRRSSRRRRGESR
jgi:hypothetical protein